MPVTHRATSSTRKPYVGTLFPRAGAVIGAGTLFHAVEAVWWAA
jgi:hypothetical protein